MQSPVMVAVGDPAPAPVASPARPSRRLSISSNAQSPAFASPVQIPRLRRSSIAPGTPAPKENADKNTASRSLEVVVSPAKAPPPWKVQLEEKEGGSDEVEKKEAAGKRKKASAKATTAGKRHAQPKKKRNS